MSGSGSGVRWVSLEGYADRVCPVDVFKGSSKRFQTSGGGSLMVEHARDEVGLPPQLAQKLSLLRREAVSGGVEVEGSVVLVLSRLDSSNSYLFLDFDSIKGWDKRLSASGSCAAKRPNQSCWLSGALLEKLNLTSRRFAVRGGVTAYKTQYCSIKIGVFNVGFNTPSGRAIPRGVLMKVDWKLRSVECYGAPPSYSSKDSFMGVSAAVLQHLEEGKDAVILLAPSTPSASASASSSSSPFIAIPTAPTIKPTDKRLLKNSCVAANPDVHVWLTAPLRDALGINDKGTERKLVAVFKTLYSPINVGFLRPCSGGSGSPPSSPGSATAAAAAAASSAAAAPASASKAAQRLCAAAKELLRKLEAAPTKMAITRYMTRRPSVAPSLHVEDDDAEGDKNQQEGLGEDEEVGEDGLLPYIEPYQDKSAALANLAQPPDSPSPFTLSGGWILPSPGESLPSPQATPPPSPFSVSSSRFSPTAAARSSIEALRLADTGRHYGCVWNSVADPAIDTFTSSKVTRSEQSLPRFFVDAPGLVRELCRSTGLKGPVLLFTRQSDFYSFFRSLPTERERVEEEEQEDAEAADPSASSSSSAWVRVLDAADLLPGDVVVVKRRASADEKDEFVGHIWIVLDAFLQPSSQRCTSALVVEAVRSTRDARDNKGGIHSRLLSNADWSVKGGQFTWAIGRLVN